MSLDTTGIGVPLPYAVRIEPVFVDLPPDLPMPVFTSTSSFEIARVGAVAVYCSDGRYGDAFDDFCHRRLDIPRYDRLAVPGGPAWLAHGADRPDLLAAAREQMEFLVRVHDLKRVVLIAHWGCAFYTRRGEGQQRASRECLPEQLRDVRAGAKVLSEWFPGVAVEAYLAMQNVGAVSFYSIALEPERARPATPPPIPGVPPRRGAPQPHGHRAADRMNQPLARASQPRA
jgi:hypothetical protein